MSSTFCQHFEKNRNILKQIPQGNFRGLQGLRILVVDDNTDNLDLVTVIFEEYQVQVKTALCVNEAIELIQEYKPDILISDICFQGQDGYSLIRSVRMKEAKQGGFLPAIALSAGAFPEDHTKAFDAGFQMYISKPFDPDELVAAVAKLCIRLKLKRLPINQKPK